MAKRPRVPLHLLAPLATLTACSAGETRSGGAGIDGERAPVVSVALEPEVFHVGPRPFAFTSTDAGGFAARVGRHAGGVARFDGEGVTVAPRDERFAVRLRTLGFGRGDQVAPEDVVEARATDATLVLQRRRLEERDLVGPEGLEQTFRIPDPPPGSGPLAIDVGFEGLSPVLDAPAARSATLVDAGGTPRAVYRDLAASDAFGRELPAHLELGDGVVRLVVDDRGARYPIDVDPVVVMLEQELPGVGADGVALDGDVLITIGAGEAGPATVFARNGTTWKPELSFSVPFPMSRLDPEVAVSGDTAVVLGSDGRYSGSHADAHVLVRTGTTWQEQARLTHGKRNQFDFVGLDGDTLVVSLSDDGPTPNPVLDIFHRSGESWAFEQQLAVGGPYAAPVTISGDRMLVGNAVWARSGSTWHLEQTLPYTARFSALSGDTAVLADVDGVAITAHVLVRSGTSWTLQQYIAPPPVRPYSEFASVAISGDVLVLGAPGAPYHCGKHCSEGRAFVYVRHGSTWSLRGKLAAAGGGVGEAFGRPVAVSGDTVAVAASYAGDVYVYRLSGLPPPDTGSGGAGGSGGAADGNGGGSNSDCGCELPGSPEAPLAPLSGVVAVGLAALARRRRS